MTSPEFSAAEMAACAEREVKKRCLPWRECLLPSGDMMLIDEVDGYLVDEHRWSVRWYKDKPARYVFRRKGTRNIHLHREIVGLGPDLNLVVDHIDGNTLDNRRRNLRIATRSENAMNGVHKRTGEFIGVVYAHYLQRWRAELTANGQHYASMHHSAIEAALARDDMARQHHGEFARLNFPSETVDQRWDRETALMKAIAAHFHAEVAKAPQESGMLL